MHDVWEPELQIRINTFLTRKAKKYPELQLTEQQPTVPHHYGRFSGTIQPSKRASPRWESAKSTA